MLIVAEIGQAHDGSIGIAHSFIDALKGSGVDAIKWQAHIARAESSPQEPFRTSFSYQDKSRFDYWERVQFTDDHWAQIKRHCENCGMEFICSPFSNMAVDLLERLGISRYKVGSGEVSNHLMLQKIAKTGKPIILSSGLSNFTELDRTMDFLSPFGNELSILQCTTSYPTRPEQWGLNAIDDLRQRFDVPIGFSDHSGDIYSCLAATALGAEIIEFHVTFDKSMFGPDSKSSIVIKDVPSLVTGINQITSALKAPVDKSKNSSQKNLKKIFGKSLAVNRQIKKGEYLAVGDLEGKKPADIGIPVQDYEQVIGKRTNRDLSQWAILSWEDLQ